MEHRIEAIDYLRGLAILLVIIIHIIAIQDITSTDYTNSELLYNLRNLFQFCVITLVVCSGFSLYIANKDLKLRPKELLVFYNKRLKRLLLPYWLFLLFFIAVHYLLRLATGVQLENISLKYLTESILFIGGISGLRFLIAAMVMLTLLFPFLKALYDRFNKLTLFTVLTLAYIATVAVFRYLPIDIWTAEWQSLGVIQVINFSLCFVLGWSIAYMLGFMIEKYYKDLSSIKREIQLTALFIVLFVAARIALDLLHTSNGMVLNKYPPSPYYLSYGIMMTFALLTLFFRYKHFMHKITKHFFDFFSTNSYWLFLYSALTISIISPIVRETRIGNIYIRFFVDVVLNLVGVVLLVLLQKKLIKAEMSFEKHHF
jgi:peptidoglycan/LPS O-acetylase OafA/YrhL